MKTLITLTLILLCLSIQSQTQEWVHNTNARGNFETITDMEVTPNGDIYICGQCDDNTPDYLIAKFNSSGYCLWWQLWDGVNQNVDKANALALDDEGNVYVTGQSYGYGFDIATVKYSSNGVFQWASIYSDPAIGLSEDIGIDIAVDNLGYVYVVGNETDWPNWLVTNVRLLRYYNNGVNNISEKIGSIGSDFAGKIALDKVNGYLYVTAAVPGYYQSPPSISWYYGIYTYKYDIDPFNPVPLWQRRFDGPGNGDDYPVDIKISSAGKIVVAGKSQGINTGWDYALISLDPNIGDGSKGIGEDFSSIRYNGPSNGDDIPSSLAVDGNGGIIVTGKSQGDGTNFDYATIRYNYLLQQTWLNRYNGSSNLNDNGASVIADAQNNIYVTGTINEDNSLQNGDYGTIKYNSAGAQQWLATFSYSANNDQGKFIGVDALNKIYVSGNEYRSNNNYKIGIVKYSQPSGGDDGDNLISHLGNSPNPFNPTTQISFSIPKEDYITLKVYNLIGEELITLIDNEFKQKGNYNIQFDAKDLPSGVYFYKLTSLNFSKTQKMLLVK